MCAAWQDVQLVAIVLYLIRLMDHAIRFAPRLNTYRKTKLHASAVQTTVIRAHIWDVLFAQQDLISFPTKRVHCLANQINTVPRTILVLTVQQIAIRAPPRDVLFVLRVINFFQTIRVHSHALQRNTVPQTILV